MLYVNSVEWLFNPLHYNSEVYLSTFLGSKNHIYELKIYIHCLCQCLDMDLNP